MGEVYKQTFLQRRYTGMHKRNTPTCTGLRIDSTGDSLGSQSHYTFRFIASSGFLPLDVLKT